VQGYRAVTHDAVTALLRNHLIAQGIVIVPRLIASSVENVGATRSGANVIRYAARYEIDAVNCDNPADKITVTGEAHANDSSDKAPGKALSYATKYALLKLFNIETGENEESRVEPYTALARITAEQAATLEALITEVGADRARFLKFLQVNELADLRARDLDEAVKALEAKRK
jgi:hypothetical protein